jgi:uncharacterized RDD family membrane protein YckC
MVSQPADYEVLVATPELVAFRYEIAGIGTRFVAQAIDSCLIGAGLLALLPLSLLIAAATSRQTGLAIGLVLGFGLVITYFPGFELLWSGQTPGKRALGIRVTGLRGESPDRTQLLVRNLLRLVDFLPGYYGIGLVAMFVTRQSRRLGDLAAGTLVVRDTESVSFQALEARLADDKPIGTDGLHGLEPNLRQLILAYAARRDSLPLGRRVEIAAAAAGPLSAAAPVAFAEGGPLAALDALATPNVPAAGSIHGLTMARRSLTAGAVACVCSFLCPPLTLIVGIYGLVTAQSALRQLAGDPRGLVTGRAEAEVGRMLSIAGLAAFAALAVTTAIIVVAGSALSR